MDKEQKVIRLESLLDLPDKYDSDEDINRTTIKSKDDQPENLSISDYLDL